MADFGSCCADLSDVLEADFERLIEEREGVLYFAVGFVETDDGLGWYDHVVFFCPFCGTKLQDPAEIAKTIGN